MIVEAWSGIDGLRAQLAPWRAILADARLDPLANAPDWTLAHAEAFAPPGDVFGWLVSTEPANAKREPVALFPFRREPSRGALALRRAILLADGTHDSDYLDLCVRPGFEDAAMGCILDALAGERRVDAVVLSGLPDDSRCLGPLRAALERRRLPRRERPLACLAAPLPGSFDEYLAGLRPRMRTKVRQALRAAKEKDARFAWCEDPERLERDLAGLYELHGARWASAGETGSFADPRRRSFYGRIARAYLAEGSLRFARLDWEGRAVAYQFGVELDGAYYQLQEGYRPDEGALRPGTALRALAIQHLIEGGARSYDFLAGDSRHKRDWGGRPRPCTTVAFALPRWRARLAYGLRAALDRRAARRASRAT